MKRARPLFVLVFYFLSVACKKTEATSTCTVPRTKIPAILSFSGFTPAQLDTVVVGTYRSGSNFTTRTRQDTTLLTDSIVILDDKAFKNGYGFFSLETRSDYQIRIPATGQSFAITDLQYTGDSLYRYTSTHGCNYKGNDFWSPDRAVVNGLPQSLADGPGPAYYIYLPR